MSSTTASGAPTSTLRLTLTVLAAFVVSLVFMVACAYAWVFIYSVLIHTSGDQAYYEAYARTASPAVAVALSFPVFYYVGRYMRHFGERAMPAALAVAGINIVMDAFVVTAQSDDSAYLLVISVLAALGKLTGAWQGARHG